MANAVVVGGAVLLPWRKGSRPFLTGFVLSGALALSALLALSLVFPRDWFTPIIVTAHDFWWKLYLSYHYTFGLSRKDYLFAAEMVFYTVLFTIPELLIAVTGGCWLAVFAGGTGFRSARDVLPSVVLTGCPRLVGSRSLVETSVFLRFLNAPIPSRPVP